MKASPGIALALALVAAPPAPAATVARTAPAAGPALAGDRVAWGEVRAGAPRLLIGAPGVAPREIGALAPASTPGATRGFVRFSAAFGASADAVAAIPFTRRVVVQDDDFVGTEFDIVAVGGPLSGPLAVLAGDRTEGGACDGAYELVAGVDVDGPRIALALERGPCDGSARPAGSVRIVAPGAAPVEIAGLRGNLHHVRLAGRRVLWLRDGRHDVLVVRDLTRGAEVARVSARVLHAHTIVDAALAPDGTVVLTFEGRRDRRGVRLGWLRPGARTVRVLEGHVARAGLAVAGGRVLYERVLRGDRRGALVLRRLGGKARVLARFGPDRRRVGALDLDGRRATWAVRRARGGGRIVLRTL